MLNFTPGRQQDASPTIRGFKYQIQLTLHRWLDLGDDEVLYLECGEDVDRVLGETDLTGAQRELEQIKARGRNVTLRTPDVLTALANFGVHLKTNPNLSIRFRFTTTALAGREKLSPLGKGIGAIQAWETLRKKLQWTADDDNLHTKLAQLIRTSSCPEKCPPDAWATLMKIVDGSGPVPFAKYLVSFEWSCGSPSPEDLSETLLSRLGALPGDTGVDDPSREQRYNQLIAALLDLLSHDGEKKLTKAILTATLARPTLTAHDRARLKLLEQHSASQGALLNSLQAAMRQLGAAEGMPLLFGSGAGNLRAIDLTLRLPEPPPLVAALAHRTTTVDHLSPMLAPATWLNLHGDFGAGKSHLSFLIAERHQGVVLGLSMRGLSAANAENCLVSLVNNAATRVTIESVTSGVVLLDDLPDAESQSRLETVLAAFVKLVLSKGRSIISTSRRPLTSNLNNTLGDSLVVQATPTFSDSDAKELFQAHRIRDDLLTAERVSSMNSMCNGHPMLLTALARHLLSEPDKPDRALLEALVANKHRTQIDLETSRAVLNTVEAEACRHLLYRLASAGTAMNLDEIRIVASAAPALAEPTGCVARLDGLWLRKAANARYEVSPLATPLGREIAAATQKVIHSQVARIVFRRATLSVPEFMRAIASFLIADEQDSAAVSLLYGCMKWPYRENGCADLGVLAFFPVNQSNALQPSNELPLRAIQAVTAGLEGHDIEPYVARIQTLTQNPTSQIAVSAILAGSTMLVASLERTPMRLAVLGASLIERFRSFQDLPKAISHSAGGYPDFVHLLLPSACIHNWDDLDSFVELLGSLALERRQEAMSVFDLRHGMQVIVFRALFDQTGQFTLGSLDRLTHIEDRCVELGLTLLGAYAATGKIIVLGEQEKDVDRVLAEGDRARARYAGDLVSLSVIDAMVGQQLYFNRRPQDGLKLLVKGLADPSHITGLERANRLVDALSAAWDAGEDPGPSVDELADTLAKEEFASSEALCQMNAQIAVIRWRQNRREDAFAHLENGVVHFLELDDSTRTRQLGAGLAHVLHYCVSVVEDGEPPSVAADGGPYAEGQPRMFSGVNNAMAGMWKMRQGPALLRWMLGRLADGLGLAQAASSWTDRALEAAIETKSPVLMMLLVPRAVATALRAGEWADAIEAAITHGRARVFLEDLRKQGSSAIEDTVVFDPFEIPAGRAAAQEAEKFCLWLLSQTIISELGLYVVKRDDRSRHALNDFADALGRVAEKSELSSAWKMMSDVMRTSGATMMSDQEHKALLADSTDAGADNAEFVAHGLLALRADVRFKQAIVSQVGALQRLSTQCKGLGISLDGYSTAITTFWETASSLAAFQFTSPREFVRAIAAAPASPPLLRAKTILRAVSADLSGTFSEEARTWLNAT
jgi:hypothetical protein